MEDRRLQPRLPEDNSVGVTVLLAPAAPRLEKKTFFCRTRDISSDGIQFRCPLELPVGARLELRLAFAHPLRAFRHVGAVTWVKPAEEEDGGHPFRVGVKFTETPVERWLIWKDNIAKRLASERPAPTGA